MAPAFAGIQILIIRFRRVIISIAALERNSRINLPEIALPVWSKKSPGFGKRFYQ
jgi:hypothetical protein